MDAAGLWLLTFPAQSCGAAAGCASRAVRRAGAGGARIAGEEAGRDLRAGALARAFTFVRSES